MNIYLREMHSNRKSLFFWCLGVIALVAGGMGKYSGMDSSEQALDELFSQMPKIILAIFGMDGINLNNASGFFAVAYFLLFIMASIHAGMLGASIISKEELDKTSEFLFVKPVTRVKIISFKIAAAITNILIFDIVSVAISFAMACSVAKGEDLSRDLWLVSLALLIFQLIFVFMGTAFASVAKKPEKATGNATKVALVAYMISVVNGFSEKLEFLKYLTPYKYFEPKVLLNGGTIEIEFLLLSAILILILAGITYIFFPKRDLSI